MDKISHSDMSLRNEYRFMIQCMFIYSRTSKQKVDHRRYSLCMKKGSNHYDSLVHTKAYLENVLHVKYKEYSAVYWKFQVAKTDMETYT